MKHYTVVYKQKNGSQIKTGVMANSQSEAKEKVKSQHTDCTIVSVIEQ